MCFRKIRDRPLAVRLHQVPQTSVGTDTEKGLTRVNPGHREGVNPFRVNRVNP